MNRTKPKARRYFSSNIAAHKKKHLNLQTGLKGFICTCNGNEKQCIRESYNLLNEYADKMYGAESVDKKYVSEDNDDVLDEFKKEVQALKSESSSANRRFQAVDTGVHNCLFIKTTLQDPIGLMHAIIEDLSLTKQKKTRFLLRMIPVDVICKAFVDDIKITASSLIDNYFKCEPTTYAIAFNRRYNSNTERDEVIEALAEMIQERNVQHKVNLTSPTFVIIVEIIKKICCMSVVRDYYQFSKYNLHSVCGEPTTADAVDEVSQISNTEGSTNAQHEVLAQKISRNGADENNATDKESENTETEASRNNENVNDTPASREPGDK